MGEAWRRHVPRMDMDSQAQDWNPGGDGLYLRSFGVKSEGHVKMKISKRLVRRA
jgi:hypothetical protein